MSDGWYIARIWAFVALCETPVTDSLIALCTSQFRSRSKGLHAGTTGTSDADFEAINACF
jgi:hypothetical protein